MRQGAQQQRTVAIEVGLATCGGNTLTHVCRVAEVTCSAINTALVAYEPAPRPGRPAVARPPSKRCLHPSF